MSAAHSRIDSILVRFGWRDLPGVDSIRFQALEWPFYGLTSDRCENSQREEQYFLRDRHSFSGAAHKKRVGVSILFMPLLTHVDRMHTKSLFLPYLKFVQLAGSPLRPVKVPDVTGDSTRRLKEAVKKLQERKFEL